MLCVGVAIAVYGVLLQLGADLAQSASANASFERQMLELWNSSKATDGNLVGEFKIAKNHCHREREEQFGRHEVGREAFDVRAWRHEAIP